MKRNLFRLWIVLLIISGSIAVWFSGIALANMCKFFILSSQTTADIVRWHVQEISSSKFAIEADYQFRIDHITYRGKTRFEKPQFLNRFSAENYVATVHQKSRKVWYQKGNPMNSTLEREFPQKDCLQSLLTVGVFSYFFFARSLVTRGSEI